VTCRTRTIGPLLFLALLCWGASARAQVLIQDFSQVIDPTYTAFWGTWNATGAASGTASPNANFVQGAGVFDITGTTGLVPTNGAGSKLEIFNPTPLSIGSLTFLSVSARVLATNDVNATSFTVTLIDTDGNSAFSTFSTFDFGTGGYATLTAPITFLNGFLATSIDEMIISGNQPSGTARFNVSFNAISAVASSSAIPEPGICAALAGVFALGFAVWRRRVALT